MNKWLKAVGKLGLKVAETTVPGVNAIESAVEAFKVNGATGADKLKAVQDAVFGGISAAEWGADKDLLNDGKVLEAYHGFVAAYVTFMEALATAKVARPVTSPAQEK